MIQKLQILLILTSVLAFAVTHKAAAQTLTLEQCVRMAIDDNKQLKKADIQGEQMDYEVKAYKSNFFPRFNLFAAGLYSTASADLSITGGQLPIYNYSAATGGYVPNVTVNSDGSYTLNQYALFPDQTIKMKVKNMFIGGINVSQPLYMGGKITAAYNMSRLGKDMIYTKRMLTRDEIIVQTIEAYMMAVKAKEMIEVSKKYSSLLAELYRNVESAFRHGMKTRNDVMKVQVKINEAELNTSKAENAFRLAKMNLCHFIGKPLTSDIDVTASEISANDISAGTAIDITQRPEYLILSQQVEMAGEQVKLTRSDYMPQVIMMGVYNYANGGEIAGKRLFNNGAATIGIGVKIPVLDFGEGSNKVRSARAKQVISQIEQADLNEQMVLEQQQALNNVDEALRELTLTQSAFSQSEENLRLSRQQYDVGYETLSDLLESQAIWQQAYAAKVEAQCQLVLATYKYWKSVGNIEAHIQ